MNNKTIQIPEICSRLRKPGLQLSELCTLINSLGDSLIMELSEDNLNIGTIKSGWDQLIEILMQTTHPTVRHIAFQNIRYFLVSRQGIFSNKNILVEICNSIIKLIYHWNVDIQFETMDIIFQNTNNDNNHPCNESILSALINSDIEVLTYILSLLYQFNNGHYDFILINILKSLKISIKNIKNKNVIMEIIDKLCQLGKNIDIEEYNKEKIENIDNHCIKYSNIFFLIHIFDIFDNISDQFQDAKIISYKIIKDELNLLINDKFFKYLEHDIFYELINNGISIASRISLTQPLVLNDYMIWMKHIWKLLSSNIQNKCFHEELMVYFRIFNSVIRSILNVYLYKGLILFIWDKEIDENLVIDNNEISNENIFIFNIDQIVKFLIISLEIINSDLYKNKIVLEYISNLSIIINIGISLKNEMIKLLIKKKDILEELSIILINFINNLSSKLNIELLNQKSCIECYFIINLLISKLYFIQHKFDNKEILYLLNKCNFDFLKWIISNFQNKDSFSNNFSELTVFLLYQDIKPKILIKRKPSKNNAFLVILENLYKLSKINQEFQSYISDILNIKDQNFNNISRIFFNFLCCHIKFSELKSMEYEKKDNIQNIICKYITSLNINNRYKYGKFFCIFGFFKISKLIFQTIKLFTIQSITWINILFKLSLIYDHLTSNNILIKENKSKLILYEIKSNLQNIQTNMLIVKESITIKNSLFIDLYIPCLIDIIELQIFYNNLEEESINFVIIDRILNIMKNLFGLINIVKYICSNTCNIIIKLYIIHKKIILKFLLLLVSYQEKERTDLKQINSNYNILKYCLSIILDQCDNSINIKKEKKNVFNTLIEKSFLENLSSNKFLDLSNKKLEIIARRKEFVRGDPIVDVNENKDDMLLMIRKNNRKLGKSTELEYLYLRRSSWKSDRNVSIINNLDEYLDNKTENKHEIRLNEFKIDFMQLVKDLGLFPPLLLTLRSLPTIYLKYELHGMRKLKEIETKNDNPCVAPTVRIYGFLRNNFQVDLIKYWRWARIKLSYILECEQELISSHFLDISVDEGQFDWTQPIELVSNIKQLNIISTPMTFNKICLGTPTIHVIPIN